MISCGQEVEMAKRWSPPVEMSKAEQFVASRLKRTGKLFLFLRRHRHELFDDRFRAELESMYSDLPRGTPPKDPALLAMVTVLQAYEQASDAVAVENALLDRRWQLVLDTHGAEDPPYSQGVLVDFRCRLIEHDMDRRLLERTVELARTTGEFGHKALRVALDSAPLAGAGRVEDTFNLIGHAMAVVVECAAVVAELSPGEVRRRSGVKLLGKSSIKAALDIDWDQPGEQKDALERLVADVRSLRAWVEHHLSEAATKPPLKGALDLLERVVQQDIEPDPDNGGSRIRQGTAKDRVISVTDPEMRHGRKSKSRTINGYKRHIAKDVGTGLVLAATVRPANEAEHKAEADVRRDIDRIGEVEELHVDRGYLPGEWPRELHEKGVQVFSKAWGSNGDLFGKGDFIFDFEADRATCPAGESAPIRQSKTPDGRPYVSFPSAVCSGCELRAQCVPSERNRGKALTLHPLEPLLQQLRGQQKSSSGRAQLRKRVTIEHSLAHVVARQGDRARYIGVRKNVFDLRRTAAVENLHWLQRREAA